MTGHNYLPPVSVTAHNMMAALDAIEIEASPSERLDNPIACDRWETRTHALTASGISNDQCSPSGVRGTGSPWAIKLST